MKITIGELARALGAEAAGDTGLAVCGVQEPALAGPDQIALAMQPKFIDELAGSRARAALLPAGTDWRALGLSAAVLAPRPRFALAGLSRRFDPGEGWDQGIHPSAVVDPDAELGDGVSVAPLAVIGAGARIGAGTAIGPHVSIAPGVVIGEGCLIREGVRIGARVRIGNRVIVQPGAVIGADGFSFVTPEPSHVEEVRAELAAEVTRSGQGWARIHSLGGVVIDDDVEIGAGTTIDRGTVRDTRIGSGTKIDNLVQIAHNVVIGEDCLICGQAGIAGSTVLGRNVVMAGQSGAADNITVGDNAVITAAAAAISNVPAGHVVMGVPASKIDGFLASYRAFRRLPRLARDIAALKKAVFKRDAND